MRKIFATILLLTLFLILPAIAFAQTTTTTNTTTTTTISIPGIGTLKDVYNFLAGFNPYVLLILGIILLAMSHLGKYIAIILIIFALIQIVLLFLH